MSKYDTFEAHEAQPQTYTVFTIDQRRYLTYFLGYLTLASSLTATIYFPLIDLLSNQYHVSVQAINFSITVYVIFQAISPAFFAPMSDTAGRRPVFILTFVIYCMASLGLALNKTSYVALVLLRSLQSIGGSAVISLAYGVVADVSHPSMRGEILGPMLASTNLGPCLGPIIGGGVISASGNPQWCFWALVVFGTSSLMLIGWTLPETARTVVGNGSVLARSIWRTWWNVLRFSASKSSSSSDGTQDASHISNDSSIDDPNSGKTGVGKLSVPNPFASLRIIFYWDTFLILWMAAAPYAVWYCIQTSITIIYGEEYGYNDLVVGLCYLPGGAGVIVGGFVAGKLMDWNYTYTAKKAGLPVDRAAGDNILQFPIEMARSRGSFTTMVFSICALTGYGWAIRYHVHASVPLILQFFIGAKCTIVLQMFSALLVDMFPKTPGTAAASNNITRCAISAAAVAILQPSVDAIGRAWFFTLIGLIEGISGLVAVYIIQQWGQSWRQYRESNAS